jgi:hypothetical protein
MEFVWPYLAGWGNNNKKDAVAVVDTICMQHNHDIQRKLIATTTNSHTSGDSSTPLVVDSLDGGSISTDQPQLEWESTMSRYNFTEKLMEAAGMKWKQATVFGDVDAATVRYLIDFLFKCVIRSSSSSIVKVID